VSPIRTTESVRCGRRAQPRVWAPAAPVLRRGRLQVGVPRWPVHSFAETDYCYGIGTLTMKLHRIEWDRPVRYEGVRGCAPETPVGRSGSPVPGRSTGSSGRYGLRATPAQ
jgi:hypothetical protein